MHFVYKQKGIHMPSKPVLWRSKPVFQFIQHKTWRNLKSQHHPEGKQGMHFSYTYIQIWIVSVDEINDNNKNM